MYAVETERIITALFLVFITIFIALFYNSFPRIGWLLPTGEKPCFTG